MVLFSHTCNTFPALGAIRNTPARILVDGEFAVYIFFILSGIVLSIGYFKHNDISRVSALTIKRIPRLGIPVFISCLFIFILMKYGLMFNAQAASLQGGNGWLSSFYGFEENLSRVFKFSFYDMFFHYNGGQSYNPVLWTMSGEFFGSLITVISILCLHFTTRKIVLLGIIVYLTSLISPIYFSFAIGISISYIYTHDTFMRILRSNISKVVTLSLFVLAYYLLERTGNLLVIQAALSILAVLSLGSATSFFSNQMSSFLGKISFPLYIVHVPIICSLTSYSVIVFQSEYGDTIFLLSAVAMTIAISISFAYLFYPVERFSIFISGKIAKFFMLNT